MKFENNFLFKELVNTFDYTTANQDRTVWTDVSINGRTYAKFGTLQAVTFVGNLYKIEGSKGYLKDNTVDTSNKYLLMVGVAKQHPCDSKINKQEGLEIAFNNALNDPVIIMEVNKNFNFNMFKLFIESYINSMKLKFIKTKEEILMNNDDPIKYNR